MMGPGLFKKGVRQLLSREFLFYIFIAGFATLVDIGLFYVLTSVVAVWYFSASVVSYFAGMVVNYSLNKVLNFKNKSKRIFSQFSLYIAVSLVGLLLTQIILFVLIEFFDVLEIVAKIIAVVIVVFWHFLGNKHITFRLIR